MLDTDILVKTEAGREEIRSRTLGLPMSVRAILLMVDGQRPVASMRALIAGSKAPADVLETLIAQGLIEPRGGNPANEPASLPPTPPPAVNPAPVTPAASSSAEPLLDLVLPTIYGSPPAEPEAPAPVAAGPAPQNAYEHLYAMMNEIVRDFLAPHRRYFFQLKIERCGTAEELLELLHGLQTALAKSRGEAFASEVISRLRAAAA